MAPFARTDHADVSGKVGIVVGRERPVVHVLQVGLDRKARRVWCGNAVRAAAELVGAADLLVQGPGARTAVASIYDDSQTWILDGRPPEPSVVRLGPDRLFTSNALNTYFATMQDSALHPEPRHPAKAVVVNLDAAVPTATFLTEDGPRGGAPLSGLIELAVLSQLDEFAALAGVGCVRLPDRTTEQLPAVTVDAGTWSVTLPERAVSLSPIAGLRSRS